MIAALPKLAAVVLLALAVAGCGTAKDVSENQLGADGSIRIVKIKRANGTTVECAVYRGVEAGGLSCDWAGAR